MITSIFQQVFAFATFKRSLKKPAPKLTATQAAWTQAMIKAEEQRIFIESIADLPADEKKKCVAKREWYRQLAERQGVAEIERQASSYWK